MGLLDDAIADLQQASKAFEASPTLSDKKVDKKLKDALAVLNKAKIHSTRWWENIQDFKEVADDKLTRMYGKTVRELKDDKELRDNIDQAMKTVRQIPQQYDFKDLDRSLMLVKDLERVQSSDSFAAAIKRIASARATMDIQGFDQKYFKPCGVKLRKIGIRLKDVQNRDLANLFEDVVQKYNRLIR
jgi:hypothetical protein